MFPMFGITIRKRGITIAKFRMAVRMFGNLLPNFRIMFPIFRITIREFRIKIRKFRIMLPKTQNWRKRPLVAYIYSNNSGNYISYKSQADACDRQSYNNSSFFINQFNLM
jgi:hypothetical protein